MEARRSERVGPCAGVIYILTERGDEELRVWWQGVCLLDEAIDYSWEREERVKRRGAAFQAAAGLTPGESEIDPSTRRDAMLNG